MSDTIHVQLIGTSFSSEVVMELVRALNAPAKPSRYVLTKKRPPFRRKRLKG